MAEREFKILITGDSAGLASQAQAGGQALGDMGKAGTAANKDMGEEAAKSTGQHKLLQGAVRLLGFQFHELRGLVRYVFNPWTIALGAVLIALRMVHAAHEKLKKAAEDAGTAGAKSFIDITNAADAAATKQIEWSQKFKEEFEGIAKAQNSAVEKTGQVITAIKEQEEALQSLATARKEFELSQTTDAHEKDLIEQRYKRTGRVIKEGAEATAIAAKEKELADAVAKAPELSAATEAAVKNSMVGPAAATRRERVQAFKEDQTRLQDQLKDAEIDYEKHRNDDRKRRTRDQIRQSLTEVGGILGRYEGEDSAAQMEVDKARKAEMENEKIIQQRRAELPGLHDQFGLHQATSAAQASYEVGASVYGDFDRAKDKIISSAGKGDVNGWIKAVVDLSVWPARMKELTDVINGGNKAVDDAIQQIQRRVSSLESTRKANPPGL